MPIGGNQYEYAEELKAKFEQAGFRTEIDLRSEKINRKIAESEQQKIPFAVIVGQKEIDEQKVSLRQHGKGDIGKFTLDEAIEMFNNLNSPN